MDFFVGVKKPGAHCVLLVEVVVSLQAFLGKTSVQLIYGSGENFGWLDRYFMLGLLK